MVGHVPLENITSLVAEAAHITGAVVSNKSIYCIHTTGTLRRDLLRRYAPCAKGVGLTDTLHPVVPTIVESKLTTS